MLLDYLRYVAFEGRLRSFFDDAVYNYVDRDETTGQHLRFSRDYLGRLFESLHYRDWRWDHAYYSGDWYEFWRFHLRIAGGPDPLNQMNMAYTNTKTR